MKRNCMDCGKDSGQDVFCIYCELKRQCSYLAAKVDSLKSQVETLKDAYGQATGIIVGDVIDGNIYAKGMRDQSGNGLHAMAQEQWLFATKGDQPSDKSDIPWRYRSQGKGR